MNKVAIKILEQAFWWTYLFISLEVELLGRGLDICITFKKLPGSIPKLWHTHQYNKITVASHPCQHFLVPIFII